MKRRNSRFPRRGRQGSRTLVFRPKPQCPLKSSGVTEVDYKDLSLLGNYVGEEWKIIPGRVNNISAGMQRQIKSAIKRARYLSLLPYTPHHNLLGRGGGAEQ